MHCEGFEGGQSPLQRRVPKRGFSNPFRLEYALVNVGQLEKLEGSGTFGPDAFKAARLFKRDEDGVKILGEGELTKAVTVRTHTVSQSARAKIEKVDGKVELI